MATCPLCDGNFADSDEFVRHLADVHGLEDDPGTSSQMEPDSSKLEPVAETVPTTPPFAPLDTHTHALPFDAPPQFPPAPAKRPPARSPRTTMIVASAIAAAGVIVALVVLRSGGGPTHETPPPEAQANATSPNTTSTVATSTVATESPTTSPLDVDLTDVAIHLSDFATRGFTTVDPPHEISSSATNQACAGPAAAPGSGPHFDSDFTYQLQPNGTEHGHVSSAVYALDSPATAQAMQAWVTSPAYGQCIAQDVAAGLTFPSGEVLRIDKTQSTPLNDLLPLAGNAVEATVQYHLDGSPGTNTERVYHLFKGQYTSAIYIDSCTCAPFPTDAVVRELLTAAATRIASLPD